MIKRLLEKLNLIKPQKPKLVISDVMCRGSSHKWKLTFDESPRQERTCEKCGKVQSTMYDMSYGTTYWTDGKWW